MNVRSTLVAHLAELGVCLRVGCHSLHPRDSIVYTVLQRAKVAHMQQANRGGELIYSCIARCKAERKGIQRIFRVFWRGLQDVGDDGQQITRVQIAAIQCIGWNNVEFR